MTQAENTLVEGARRLAGGSSAARGWIEAVRQSAVSVANEAHGLRVATRRAENAARKMVGAAGRRNCVGVFGPSQAGKSYLVSALARPAKGQLKATFGTGQKDFLTEINPPGDRESTGLVTRFTGHGGGVLDPAYPVELRLLTETDLVKILGNSFLSDFDPNNMTVPMPDETMIREAIAAAEAAAAGKPAAHLDEIVLYDLGEYFQRNFAARIEPFNRTNFWEALIQSAGRLPLARRAQLYALLWGRIGQFTDVFLLLAGALERIGHVPEAHAVLTALIPRDKSIIDVELLVKHLGTPEDTKDLIEILPLQDGVPGAPAALPRAVLGALVAELKIVMNERPWPFFEHTDLLDFPGARSRLKLYELPPEPDKRDEQVRELLLRGKIAYLFQRFTEERELTAMLLCMPPSVAEVKDLAGMVRSWIEITHGATPELRAKAKNALFLVLTKFDLEFQEKGGETAESRRGKWDRRLQASFLELYGKDNWPRNWNGRPFDNALFLRNPGMKQEHIIEYEEIAREADGSQRLVEAGPAKRQEALIAEYRAAFEESELCGQHFRDLPAVWDGTFAPNDGGIRLLVRRLDAVLDPGLKAGQIRRRLLEEASHLETGLKRFYHADDARARQEREQVLSQLRIRINAALKQTDYAMFAPLLHHLMLNEGVAVEVFRNVAALKLDRQAPVAPTPAAATPAAIDDDPWGADPWAADPSASGETGGTVANPSRAAPDRPDIFTEMLINRWTEGLRNLSQNAGLLAVTGVTAEVLDDLVQEIIVGAHRIGLRGAIATGVRTQVQAANTRWDDVVDRAVGIALMRLNDYVAWLGFAGLDEAKRPGFPEAPQPRQRAVFTLPPAPAGLPALDARRRPLERERFIDWGVAMRQLGLDNISFAGGREIDEAQNRALGAILEQVAIGRLVGPAA